MDAEEIATGLFGLLILGGIAVGIGFKTFGRVLLLMLCTVLIFLGPVVGVAAIFNDRIELGFVLIATGVACYYYVFHVAGSAAGQTGDKTGD